jgi:hypothetical protein
MATVGPEDFLKTQAQRNLEEFNAKIEAELQKPRPNQKVLQTLQSHRVDVMRKLAQQGDDPAMRFLEPEKVREDVEFGSVRSNKTNRKLRRAVEERGGLTASVRSKKTGHVGRGPLHGGAHYQATEALARQVFGPNYRLSDVDDLIDAGIEEGFTTSRKGFLTRKEITDLMVAQGKSTYGERAKFGHAEAHAPDIWNEQRERLQKEGPAKAVAIGRRGREGEREIRTRRKKIQGELEKVNKEIGDLTRRTPSRRVEGVKTYDPKLRRPTGKYSPYELRVALIGGGSGPEVNQMRRDRLKSLYRRRDVLRQYQAFHPEDETLQKWPLRNRPRNWQLSAADQGRFTAEGLLTDEPRPVVSEREPLIKREALHEKAARMQTGRQAEIEATRARRAAPRQRTSPATRRAGVAGLAASGLYLAEAGIRGGAEGVAEAARTEAKTVGTAGALALSAKKLVPGLASKAAPILTKAAAPLAVAATLAEAARLTSTIGAELGGYEKTDEGVRLKKGMTDLYKQTHKIAD